MGSKNNARAIQGTLEDSLKSDSKLLSNFGKVVGFAAAAASGEPMSAAILIGKIMEAGGAAIEGATEFSRRLSGPETSDGISSINNFERFKAVFNMMATDGGPGVLPLCCRR